MMMRDVFTLQLIKYLQILTFYWAIGSVNFLTKVIVSSTLVNCE